jgi:hypothetical protein
VFGNYFRSAGLKELVKLALRFGSAENRHPWVRLTKQFHLYVHAQVMHTKDYDTKQQEA